MHALKRRLEFYREHFPRDRPIACAQEDSAFNSFSENRESCRAMYLLVNTVVKTRVNSQSIPLHYNRKERVNVVGDGKNVVSFLFLETDLTCNLSTNVQSNRKYDIYRLPTYLYNLVKNFEKKKKLCFPLLVCRYCRNVVEYLIFFQEFGGGGYVLIGPTLLFWLTVER